MIVFDFIKRMFGEGKIRAEFICSDGTSGSVKAPYIGQYIESEVLEHLKNAIEVEYGKKITHIKIVAHAEN
jgi:hypothetical protein